MAQRYVDEKLLGTLMIVIIFAVALWYGMPYLMREVAPPPGVPTYQYTTGLTAWFKIYDNTAKTVLTANVQPDFYVAGTDPLPKVFIGEVIETGSYDSSEAKWQAILDAGTYVLCIKDTHTPGSEILYPAIVTVTVPGTNESTMEVNINPFMPKMIQRASVTITKNIYAYNPGTEAYDTSVANINVTDYDKWLIEYRISVTGKYKELEAGRLYFNDIQNLPLTILSVDGTRVGILSDKDTSDDGLAGSYTEFATWAAGESHFASIYVEETGTVTTPTTFVLTIADYYLCQNADLKWWSYSTDSTDVVS